MRFTLFVSTGDDCGAGNVVDTSLDDGYRAMAADNRSLSLVVVVPVTGNTGRHYPSEAVVTVGGQSSKVMADQVMVADKSRLKTQIGALSKADMLAVEDAIKVHLALPK